MASEDVIELGSSDEEPDPAPKKAQPRLNAMVHIPKLSGVTIKPTKSNHPKKPKEISGSVTISKTPSSETHAVAVTCKPKHNGKQPQLGTKVVENFTSKSMKVINPFNVPGNRANNQVITKISRTQIGMNPIQIQGIKQVNNLPSSITVKKAGSTKNVVLNRNAGTSKSTGVNKIAGPNKNVVSTRIVGPTALKVQNAGPYENTPDLSLPQVIPNFAQIVPKITNLVNNLHKNSIVVKDMTKTTRTAQSANPKKANTPWYRTPDENLEEQNNKEPAAKKFVEITIEDSPVKLIQNKRTNEIGTELAITIDDSPVKTVITEQNNTSSSDNEESNSRNKEAHSKKKLKYPTENTIEIEIDPIEVDSPNEVNCTVQQIKGKRKKDSSSENESNSKKIKKTESVSESVNSTESLVINDDSSNTGSLKEQSISRNSIKRKVSPENRDKCDKDVKNKEDSSGDNSKKIKVSNEDLASDKSKGQNISKVLDEEVMVVEDKYAELPSNKIRRVNPIMLNKEPEQPVSKEIEISDDNSAENSEFNPVYQKFIDLCFKLENSEDMMKIVEKKIKAYYRQVPKEYTESEEFVDMVSSKIEAMKAGPEKMYLYIKDIVDELNMQRKAAKSQNAEIIKAREEEKQFLYGEESGFDSKRQRQIRKLEKTLRKLHRAISKLEEQEVDFDDDEDSVYLLTERYKERMVRVHAKFCQLTNTKMPSEPKIHVECRPGQPAGPARRLEKWINKKVPVGSPLPFPDFHDVLRCVREANAEDELGWNEADIMEEARDLFTRCGKKLQRRRQENEWRLAASRISNEVGDPAEASELLKKQLDVNKQLASKRETEVLNKYADRQSQLKLEAEEIDDKEAEKSPVESDDEPAEREETSPLQDKEIRKQRLRRLLHKKSQKGESNDKENSNEKQIEILSEDGTEPTDPTNKGENLNSNKDGKPNSPNNVENEKKSASKKVNDTTNKSDQDTSKLESDIDELHLLQKLHSESEMNSSADSDTPIAISDTLTSSSENDKNKASSDIISIENSSYSESETAKEMQKFEEVTSVDEKVEETADDKIESIVESDHTEEEIIKSQKENVEELQIAENCLLESSDEEKHSKNSDKETKDTDSEYVNLKDDNISIGETVIEDTVNEQTKTNDLPQNVVESLDSNSVESIPTNVESNSDDVPKENSVSLSEEDSYNDEEHSPGKENCISLSEEDSNKKGEQPAEQIVNDSCEKHVIEAETENNSTHSQEITDSSSVEHVQTVNNIEIQIEGADSNEELADRSKSANDCQPHTEETNTEESIADQTNEINILEKPGAKEDLENLLKDLSEVYANKDADNKETEKEDVINSNPGSQEYCGNITDKENNRDTFDSNSQDSIQEIADSGDDSQV